jgi:hypothetical protein
LVIGVHYAHRMPSVSFRFGLYDGQELIGVVLYGTPAAHPQRTGVCGPDYAQSVLELNRLVLKYNRPNEASYLVSKSLALLPRERVILSYADPDQGHLGIVYQATNFVYCGLSEKRTDWTVAGKELHGQSIADESRGQTHRAAFMREKYGDDFSLAPRTRKHRYVTFTKASHKWRRDARAALRYPTQPYPKEIET